MRLSENEISAIKTLARHHFGSDVEVFLFGSRIFDNRRGGDIDLFIRTSNGDKLKIRSKISFLTDLIVRIGEQKVDVILDHPEIKNTVFYQTIFKEGIQLC